MPFGVLIKGAVVWAITSAVGRIMVALGVAFVAIALDVPSFLSQIAADLANAPDWFRETAGLMQLDRAITIVLSAIGIRMTYRLFLGRQ